MTSAKAAKTSRPPAPIFFATAAELRAWFEAHHATAPELVIGFFKKNARRRGVTYAQAVDEALCFGWIDGVVHRLDEERYQQRYTPRRARSIWSNVNVAHVARLTAAGRMHPAGLAAFAARDPKRTGIYSFERSESPTLSAAEEQQFRASPGAWAFFQAQPPGYRRAALFKVVSPKLPATRARWLARLIADSASGRRLAAVS